jgi:cellulose synthase/poly-beta-1,6-N-acetylglucosamine synthase-like glycosyltransferase
MRQSCAIDAKMSAFPPMIAVRAVQCILGLIAFAGALYVVAMPLFARIRPVARRAAVVSQPIPSIAVIVPSHDMEAHIVGCVAALRASAHAPDRVKIYIVADHCTDGTAERAREAGVNVLERRDGPAGKTYAIAWSLEMLAARGCDSDIYVITDATARVDPGFLEALAAPFRHGEEIVIGHSIVASDNRKWFAKCLGLTLVHRNFQNWARERLGLSSLIEGRGMGFSRHYIRRFGWTLALPTQTRAGLHPTEDWRHGVRVVEHGFRVAYADEARVFTPLRESLGAATRQGIRWERGRQLNAVSHGAGLLRIAFRSRNRVMFFAALDAIQLPVAILGVLCAAVATLTYALPGGWALNTLGFAPVALMTSYGVQVTLQGRHEGIPLSTIVWAPVYLLWRLASFVLAWTSLDRARSPRRPPAR